jgi:hypothetical protein
LALSQKIENMHMFDGFLEYEAMTFALGGEIACPDCGMVYNEQT